MISATTAFKAALRESHTVLTRLTLYTRNPGGTLSLVGPLDVIEGTYSADGTANIWRSLTATIATGEITLDESVGTWNSEVVLERGIALPGGNEWVTVATLRVDSITPTLTKGNFSLQASDSGSRVSEFRLVTPYAPLDVSNVTLTYVEAIKDLVKAAYPSTSVPSWTVDAGVDITSKPKDGTAFQGDRWSAVLSLSKAIACVVHQTPTGTWRIRKTPTAVGTSVWTFDPGEGGVLIDASTRYSREDVYNAVAIRWEQPDGSGGLAYIVDSDPTSPTYYDGPFGRRPRDEETLDTVTSSAQAIAAATALLVQYRGKVSSIDVTAVHNPLVEPLDFVSVEYPDGTTVVHIVDKVSFSLKSGSGTYATRAVRAV